MSLFDDTRSIPRNVSVTIRKVYGRWYWAVTYEGSPLFDRMGFAGTRDKALQKALKAVERIGRYEKKESR